MSNRATFKAMVDSTEDDWNLILNEQRGFIAGLPDRIMQHMMLLDADFGGFPVDQLQHCLQTAELAAEDGRDDEYVVCALLHDIGDTLGSLNHADVAAAILEPVDLADGNVGGLIFLKIKYILAEGDAGGSPDHNPVLGPVFVLLQRERRTRFDRDAFDLKATACV